MIPENLQAIENQLLHFLKNGEKDALKTALEELHASDLALILEELENEERVALITSMDNEKAADALSEMDPESHPEELFEFLTAEQSKAIISELDSDDATDLVSLLPETEQDTLLRNVDEEDAADIRQLMAYPEDSAGGLMSKEIMSISEKFNRREAMEEIVRRSDEVDDFYYIYIVDEEHKLKGVVSLKNLIRAKPFAQLSEITEQKSVYVTADTDQEEVARVFSKYNLASLPVVDQDMKLLGRITFDDVMDVMEEETTEDILKIAGVSEDARLTGGWYNSVASRIPWLMLNLLTASIAGFVIFSFNNIIEQISIIVAYMPIIAGVAGNGATQTLAVTLRRISVEKVPKDKIMEIVLKEVLVGLSIGLVIGLSISLFAYLSDGNILLGVVVFLAMTLNLLISGLAGSAIPLLLNQLGVDPALASSIFITALTDILGFTILLSLTSWIIL
jgi:magnesium transporter